MQTWKIKQNSFCSQSSQKIIKLSISQHFYSLALFQASLFIKLSKKNFMIISMAFAWNSFFFSKKAQSSFFSFQLRDQNNNQSKKIQSYFSPEVSKKTFFEKGLMYGSYELYYTIESETVDYCENKIFTKRSMLYKQSVKSRLCC